jgi:hypothetical protein
MTSVYSSDILRTLHSVLWPANGLTLVFWQQPTRNMRFHGLRKQYEFAIPGIKI